ncbi:hypothetical protein ARSEF1564_009316 [Beauveria bassiana]
MAYLDPANQAFVDSLKGPPLYEKSYKDARQVLEDIQNFKAATDVTQETVSIDVEGASVETVIFRPANANGVLKMIFYTHGGGWILGSPTVHGTLMEDFVRQTGAAVVFPYYTPAPEAQFPEQFEQSYGNMAIAMTQLAQLRGLPAEIGQLVLLYPVTDTHAKSETYKQFQTGPYLEEKTMDWMINAFLPKQSDRRNALASPLAFATDEVLAKFPPTTIFVSGADPLIGEGEAFGRRLQQLGVDAAILKAEGVIHDYVICPWWNEECKDAHDDLRITRRNNENQEARRCNGPDYGATQGELERRDASDDITDAWQPAVGLARDIPFSRTIPTKEIERAVLHTGNTTPGSDGITTKMLQAA